MDSFDATWFIVSYVDRTPLGEGGRQGGCEQLHRILQPTSQILLTTSFIRHKKFLLAGFFNRKY